MGHGTKLLGSGILNFCPLRRTGPPGICLVGSDDRLIRCVTVVVVQSFIPTRIDIPACLACGPSVRRGTGSRNHVVPTASLCIHSLRLLCFHGIGSLPVRCFHVSLLVKYVRQTWICRAHCCEHAS